MPEDQLLKNILEYLVGPAIGILFMVAFIVFLWGVFKYISKGGDPATHKEGGLMMLYGILGIAIMFGVSGIISFVAKTLNVPEEPKFEFPKDLKI